jgi:hypothetical protein
MDARGNVLFVHTGDAGEVTGFEVKTAASRGSPPEATKTAWRSAGRAEDRALVVTESAIDTFGDPKPQRL